MEAKAEGEAEAEAKVEELQGKYDGLRVESMGRGWRLLVRAAALRGGVGVRRVGMVRPLAVWRRLQSRLEKNAYARGQLKAALDAARGELQEVSADRDDLAGANEEWRQWYEAAYAASGSPSGVE